MATTAWCGSLILLSNALLLKIFTLLPQGCFWGVEQKFAQKFKGAVQTTVGYTGGTTQKPTYGQVHLKFVCFSLVFAEF